MNVNIIVNGTEQNLLYLLTRRMLPEQPRHVPQ
jgi:hypothetical protein